VDTARELLKGSKGVKVIALDSIVPNKFAEDAEISSSFKQYHTGRLDGIRHRHYGLLYVAKVIFEFKTILWRWSL